MKVSMSISFEASRSHKSSSFAWSISVSCKNRSLHVYPVRPSSGNTRIFTSLAAASCIIFQVCSRLNTGSATFKSGVAAATRINPSFIDGLLPILKISAWLNDHFLLRTQIHSRSAAPMGVLPSSRYFLTVSAVNAQTYRAVIFIIHFFSEKSYSFRPFYIYFILFLKRRKAVLPH